jgi:hypothetical protein
MSRTANAYLTSSRDATGRTGSLQKTESMNCWSRRWRKTSTGATGGGVAAGAPEPHTCSTGGRAECRALSAPVVAATSWAAVGCRPPTAAGGASPAAGTRPAGTRPNAASTAAAADAGSPPRSPTRYRVALPGQYQCDQNSSRSARCQRRTWSGRPIGNRSPSAFSPCSHFNSWQSTRYSIVFIICASASTAARSFSSRAGSSSGSNAISARAASTWGSMAGEPGAEDDARGACTWKTVWWKSV